MLNYINPEGLIPLLGGIYGLLMAKGGISKKPENSQASQQWQEKYGKMLTVLSPILIVFGLLQLFKVF